MKLALTTLALLAGTNAFATTKVNNGFGDFKLLYTCEQEQKTAEDAMNPRSLKLFEVNGVIRLTEEIPADLQNLTYAATMVKNNDIRCIIACDIYDGQTENVRFGVTKFGKLMNGTFTKGDVTTNYVCKAGPDNN
jgi:hypothetical protein